MRSRKNAVALGLFASGVADFPIRPALQVGQLLQHLDNVPQLVQGALLQELPHLFPELVLQALDVLLVPQGADNRCASLLADDVGHIVPHQLVVDMLFHTVRHVSFLKYFENPAQPPARTCASRSMGTSGSELP